MAKVTIKKSAKKTVPAKKVVAKKAVAKKVAVKKAAPAAKKPAAKKIVTKKVVKAAKAPAKKILAKKVVAKKAVAKKPVAKALVKKAVAKKIVKKPAAKKVAVKKVPAKKIAAKKPAPVKAAVLKKAVKAKKVMVAVTEPVAHAPKKVAAKKAIAPAKKPTRPAFVIKKNGGLPEQLLEATLKILDERKAEDINTIDLSGKSAMADYVVVASGQAARQIAAIAQYLQDAYFKLGMRDVRIEGLREGNWVLVDCGDVIVHLFRPEVREYYDLESLWTRTSTATARPPRSKA